MIGPRPSGARGGRDWWGDVEGELKRYRGADRQSTKLLTLPLFRPSRGPTRLHATQAVNTQTLKNILEEFPVIEYWHCSISFSIFALHVAHLLRIQQPDPVVPYSSEMSKNRRKVHVDSGREESTGTIAAKCLS